MLRWNLRPDGSLDGEPVVVNPARGDALFQLAADAAIRAVKECSPFPLPPDKYSAWKTIERNFDPSSMLR
jgi:colicin import membrane protein